MKTITRVVLSLIVLGFFTGVVTAQYDTPVIQPTIKDGAEVFGIDIKASEKVSFFPDGCESIDKITIEAKNNIKGDIKVVSLKDNPKQDAEKIDPVFEYCKVELVGINQDDIKSVFVEAKVRKTWLDDNKLSKDQISLFTFNEKDNKWVKQDSADKTESSIYQFYESQAGNFPYWAVAKSPNSVLASINPGLILLCCIVLLILLILAALILGSRRKTSENNA